ncbi:MAG: family 16 glycoside hydrolase [Candidatus Firestonebacteria bacterium]
MLGKLVLALFIGLFPVLEYKDNFTSKDLCNWEVLSGNWNTVAGELHGTSGGGDGLIFYKGSTFKNFELECKMRVENREGSLVFRASDKNNLYILVLSPKVNEESQGSLMLIRRIKGKETYFAGSEQYFRVKEPVKLKVICEGKKIDVYVNENLRLSVEDDNLSAGYTGLRVFGDFFNSAGAYFKEFSVKETEKSK